MSRSLWVRLLSFLWAATLPLVVMASPAAECYRAIRTVANESGVPHDILLAVSLTETGRSRSNAFEPWPWALNQAGRSFWMDSRQQAIAQAEALLQSGITNLDLGCFQLNWRWHGENFSSVTTMIDPLTNTRYAATFLSDLYHSKGDWAAAVRAYHSNTPDLAEKYYARFFNIYEGLAGHPLPQAPLLAWTATSPRAAHRVIRVNSYPLLQEHSDGAAQLGSLFSSPRVIRPLIGD